MTTTELPTVGETLPNGATVLKARFQRSPMGPECIVLALWNAEFVTWSAARPEISWFTYWGHYFDTDLESALTDFKTR
jgi:hypothetical protein